MRSRRGIRITSIVRNGPFACRTLRSLGDPITNETSCNSANAAACEYVTYGMLTANGSQNGARSKMRIRLTRFFLRRALFQAKNLKASKVADGRNRSKSKQPSIHDARTSLSSATRFASLSFLKRSMRSITLIRNSIQQSVARRPYRSLRGSRFLTCDPAAVREAGRRSHGEASVLGEAQLHSRHTN